jgi:hypothetical protein
MTYETQCHRCSRAPECLAPGCAGLDGAGQASATARRVLVLRLGMLLDQLLLVLLVVVLTGSIVQERS